VVRERYEVGVATLFEVVTSQLALDEAETTRVSTRYDYLLARAELESILGREL
jgi:outer membrane protein TolC